jgi:hypothetical protein
MDRRVRADALWLASVGRDITPPNDLTHPTNVRMWLNEQAKTAEIPEDAPVFTIKKSVEITSREAAKAAKLITRSKFNDEGSVIAKRHLESIVNKLDTTVEELEEPVSAAIPEVY